jgi:hypothetical protein
MNPHQPNEDRGVLSDMVTGLSLLVMLLHAVGHLHALFTRRWGSMGREYPSGFVAVVGIIVVPMMSVLIVPPSYGAEFVWPYCLLLIALAVLHGLAKHRQKQHVHRHYIGDPWLKIGDPSRRRGEWVLGWILIGLCFLLSNTLGFLQLVSLICNAMTQDMIEARDRRIIHQMRDGQLEAEYYANRLKDQ